MARLSRITQKIFGSSASDIGVFGSAAVGTPTTSTAIATIMAAASWATGWLTAVLGASKFPAVEDMNAIPYVITNQLAYIFQQGLAIEYDSGTTYFNSTTKSIVMQPGTTNLFASLTDNNTGNALPTAPASNTNWQYLGDLSTLSSQNVFRGGTTTGSANAQTLASLTPSAGFSIANNGDVIICTSGFTNAAGALTLAITSPVLAATPVKVASSGGYINPPAGAVHANEIMVLIVDSAAGVLVLDEGFVSTLFLQSTNNLSDVANTTTARTNLGAAASGANTDITSLQGSALIIPAALGIGSIITALSSVNIAANATTSASNLTSQNTTGGNTGDSLSGTWRSLQTYTLGGSPTQLFQRIA